MKEGEGVSQRTYMKDPWTWTDYGSGARLGGGEQRDKKYNNCNSINKVFFLSINVVPVNLSCRQPFSIVTV